MNKLLEIKLRVLLLQHGRKEVIQALAALGEQTLDEVEAKLRAAEQSKPLRQRKPISALDTLAEIAPERPDTTETLRKLATRYDNRSFLPQLRDVHRFLESLGASHKNAKSRHEAARQVVRALARLSPEELRRYAAASEEQTDSDYAALARQIMGRH